MKPISAVRAVFSAGCVALAFASVHAAPATPAAWPQFRGPGGSGVGREATPPAAFGPADGVRWSVAVPWSPSSPCIWGDRIFLTTFHDGRLETRCYDRADGTLRWTRGVQPDALEDFHRSDGSPAAATPATDGRHVVSYFGSFGVICHDRDGNELWRHPLPAARSAGQYGSGTSPIIVGETVVLNRDQYRYSSLLALDVRTGAVRWETPRLDAAGSFGTPAHWNNAGTDEIAVAASGRLKGYDLATGAERWSVEGLTGYVCTTPIAGDGLLYFAAWSNSSTESAVAPWAEFAKQWDKNGDGAVAYEEIDAARRDYFRGLDHDRDGRYTETDWEKNAASRVRYENLIVAVKPGGRGDITSTHVAWSFRRGLPYVPSPLLYDGRIYLVKDGGLLTSLDARTGEPHYVQERLGATGNYYASPVAADGRILLASVAGKVTVVRAGGAAPEVVHRADFGSRILATPALVGDRLYLRTATHLWAF